MCITKQRRNTMKDKKWGIESILEWQEEIIRDLFRIIK